MKRHPKRTSRSAFEDRDSVRGVVVEAEDEPRDIIEVPFEKRGPCESRRKRPKEHVIVEGIVVVALLLGGVAIAATEGEQAVVAVKKLVHTLRTPVEQLPRNEQ